MKTFDYKIDLTPELAQEIVHAVELGNHIETAAMVIGVPPAVLNRWLAKGSKMNAPEPYRSFALGVRDAWARSERTLVEEIARQGGSRPDKYVNRFGEAAVDWKALAWLLERRDPKRWGMQIQVNVREELTQMLGLLEANLPPAEYERVLAIISGDKGTPALGPASTEELAAIRATVVQPKEEEQPPRKKKTETTH